jgi:dTDP-4-dehydrorhamnose reductase
MDPTRAAKEFTGHASIPSPARFDGGVDGSASGGTLLVLGGSGFLGVPLIEQALDSGKWQRLLLAARDPGAARLWPRALRDSRLERLVLDLATSAPEWGAVLDRLAVSSVLNLAANADGGACERDPEGARRVNALGPGHLAAACARRGLRLLHCSTDLVHGALAPPPGGFPDDAPAAPLSTYGRTKAEGEQRILEAHPGALVVRLPLLFGFARGTARGASAPLLADLAAGRPVTLFTDEQRQPLEVGLAAGALLRLLESAATGLLNLPGPESLSRADFGRRLLAAAWARGLCLPEPRYGRRADLGLAASRPADTRLSPMGLSRWLPPFEPLDQQIQRALDASA